MSELNMDTGSPLSSWVLRLPVVWQIAASVLAQLTLMTTGDGWPPCWQHFSLMLVNECGQPGDPFMAETGAAGTPHIYCSCCCSCLYRTKFSLLWLIFSWISLDIQQPLYRATCGLNKVYCIGVKHFYRGDEIFTVCAHFQRVANKDGAVDGGHDCGTNSCQRPRQCSKAQLLVNIEDENVKPNYP